jgi:hypothetical protein
VGRHGDRLETVIQAGCRARSARHASMSACQFRGARWRRARST